MKSKLAKYGLASILIVVQSLLLYIAVESYRDLPYEIKNQVTAISFGIIGILIHFLKKRTSVQNHILTFESLELLALIFTPIFVVFEIIKTNFQNNPDYIIIVSLIGTVSWFWVTQNRTSHARRVKEGKYVSLLSGILFGGIIAISAIALWTIIQIHVMSR